MPYKNKADAIANKKQYQLKNKDKIKVAKHNNYMKNRQEQLANANEYYLKNRGTILIQRKQYREENREKIRLKQRTHYKLNKAKIRVKQKQYYDLNSEAIGVTNRKYERNHPEITLKSIKKQMEYIGSFLGLDSLQTAAGIHSWSRTVRKRDNNKCTWCNSTKTLVSHHIWHKAFCPESALDVDNGITLCHDCHMEQHRLDKL
jgi:hypothetical protein